jgi:copper resistance protein D
MLCLWLDRWAHIYASSLLVSLFAFERLYVGPALDSSNQVHLSMPGKCLRSLTWICWVIMSLSGILWLLAVVTSMIAKMDFDSVEEVLSGTQFGHLWIFRSLLSLAIVGGLLRQTLKKRPHLNLLWAGLAAVNLASLAWASHAGAATGSLAAVHLLADVSHLLVSAIWPGGLLPLTAWYLVSARAPTNVSTIQEVLQRFSAISLGAVAALGVSGVLNGLFMLKEFSDFYLTPYGQILAVKIILFLVMIVLGAQNRHLLKVQRQSDPLTNGSAPGKRLFRNICIESALAFVVFGLVGVLGAVPPPGAVP